MKYHINKLTKEELNRLKAQGFSMADIERMQKKENSSLHRQTIFTNDSNQGEII